MNHVLHTFSSDLFVGHFKKQKEGEFRQTSLPLQHQLLAAFRPNFLPFVKLCQTYFWVQMFWFYIGHTIMLLLEPEQTVVLSSVFIEAKFCLSATFHILRVERGLTSKGKKD